MPERPRVFVARVLPGGDAEGSPLARLHEATDVEVWPRDDAPSPGALRERAATNDGLLIMITERIDGALLEAAPRLRAVANVAVGYDNIDVPACTSRAVIVTNTPGVVTDATADIATEAVRAVAACDFEHFDPHESKRAFSSTTSPPCACSKRLALRSRAGCVGA